MSLRKNCSKDDLLGFYKRMQRIPELVAKEVTFTVNPSVTGGIQESKKYIMLWATWKLRRLNDKGLRAYMFTRENHENGWAHLHGIVWFNCKEDNSLMLCRPMVETVRPDGSKFYRKVTVVPQIGRTWVDPLRTERYMKDNVEWDGWIDYIMKEQHINWRESNILYEDLKIVDFVSVLKDDGFVD